MEEEGGINLYAYVANQPVLAIDIDGGIGVDANEAHAYWESVRTSGYNRALESGLWNRVGGYGQATGANTLMLIQDLFQTRKIQNQFDAGFGNLMTDYGWCQLLAMAQLTKGVEMGVEDATLLLGAASFGRNVYPRMTPQSVLDVNKPWKNISGRKVYKDWRDEYRTMNDLGKGQVDIDHWAIEQKSWLGRKLPDGVVNNPLNLNPTSSEFNRWDKTKMAAIEKLLKSSPAWARYLGVAGLTKVLEEIQTLGMAELEKRCECQKKPGSK